MESSHTGRDGFIYPDCAVACTDESNFSKYIMICEVKSSSDDFIKEMELAQLIREMLGACTNQSEVFGTFMNACQVIIVRMRVDEEYKKIEFGQKLLSFC